MVNTGLHRHRIYVDETGLNLWLSLTRGRAVMGDRVARIVCGQRGRNMTVLMAVSDQIGVVYYEVAWGGVNVERFRIFSENLSVVLGDEPAVLIMDNAPAHREAETLATDQVKKLSPHSPFLNPIENCFSIFKADLKQRLGQIQDRLDDRAAALATGHRGLVSWRSSILEDLAGQAVASVTQEKVAATYAHANSFIGACLAREDILAEG